MAGGGGDSPEARNAYWPQRVQDRDPPQAPHLIPAAQGGMAAALPPQEVKTLPAGKTRGNQPSFHHLQALYHSTRTRFVSVFFCFPQVGNKDFPKVIGSSSNFAGCCCYGLTRPCALHRVPFAPDAGDKGRREQAGVVHQPWHLTGDSNLEEASYKVEASYRVEASYQVGTSYQQRLVIR